jgi:methylenetetrahydrofolate reductase (NADPH)
MTVKAPDRLIADLAHYKASDPACGIRQAHIYPLGGLRRSALWVYAVLDGDFTLGKDDRSFTIDRELP